MASTAEAIWLIDPGRFINSVHGENSCQDCHEDIAEKDLHPDPGNVNKKLSDFFSIEQCSNCHDEISDDLNEGRHGSIKINIPKGYEDCIQCHDPHYQPSIEEKAAAERKTEIPEFSDADKTCMACHGAVNTDDSNRNKTVSGLCFHCHGQGENQARKITSASVALIDAGAYSLVPHADINCLVCHPRAPAFEHDKQIPADCRECHAPHDEKVAHDAHRTVACQSCHLQDVQPLRDPQTRMVAWKSQRNLGSALKIHEMRRDEDLENCRRCHIKDNTVGAAAMILPAKSVICLPCHTATISFGDTTTILALIIFLFGLLMTFSYVLTGSISEANESGAIQKFFRIIGSGLKVVFSPKISILLKAFGADVLFQRRLYYQSVSRWLIHSLIFMPLVFRFVWGVVALLTSLYKPESELMWFMLDKNHAATAFLFDLSGILILAGIVLAFVRGARQSDRPAGLPHQDRFALALIGGMVLIGFILEGLRIAMTGSPQDAAYAFVGYGISSLFNDFTGLNQVYGYVWYTHAITAGAFIAYLPFSRLSHIIMAPFVLAMRAVAESEHEKGHK